MWKKIAPLLIVLSVALNIAFVSVWAVHAIRGRWPGWGRCGREGAGGAVWCPMHRRLGVTDEQWQQIEPRMTKFRRDSETLCQEITRKRGELIDLLAASPEDRKAIDAKQAEILAGQQRMQQLVINHLLEEKTLLKEDQSRRLFDMLRCRSGCAGHRMDRGGQHHRAGAMKHAVWGAR